MSGSRSLRRKRVRPEQRWLRRPQVLRVSADGARSTQTQIRNLREDPMDALVGLLALASIVGAPVGLLMCLSASKRDLGKTIALGSVACFGAILAVIVARGPTNATKSASAETVAQTAVQPQPENLTRSQMLANFRVSALSWHKDGFGTIMMASFVVHNDNRVSLRDIEVTCSSTGPSGSIIDTNARTVYEVVRDRSYLQVDKLNMGFIRTEATGTKCRVTGFARA